jgi:hypothetical protein
MLKLTITLISFVFILNTTTITYNEVFADYHLPLNITYTKDNATLTLTSAENFKEDCSSGTCAFTFDLVMEADDTDLYFKDSFPIKVRITY